MDQMSINQSNKYIKMIPVEQSKDRVYMSETISQNSQRGLEEEPDVSEQETAQP